MQLHVNVSTPSLQLPWLLQAWPAQSSTLVSQLEPLYPLTQAQL
jgi:hypothetical protein